MFTVSPPKTLVGIRIRGTKTPSIKTESQASHCDKVVYAALFRLPKETQGLVIIDHTRIHRSACEESIEHRSCSLGIEQYT